MKNRIIALLLTLVMLVGMVGVFASCGEEEPVAQECTTHSDKNGDGKCDVCQATVEKPKDPTTDDPTDDPTEDDPTTDDPTEDDPTEDDPTEDDPTEDDPTEDDPTEDDPTEDDPTEDTPKPPMTDFCDHYDDNYDGYCDECDTLLEAEHECYDDDGDGECDECGVLLDETKVVSYPWNKQTLIFQFTENDNGKELSS